MVDRPLVDEDIEIDFSYSRRNASFTGGIQDKVVSTDVEQIVTTDTQKTIQIPSREDVMEAVELSSAMSGVRGVPVQVESAQTISGQAILIEGDTQIVELGTLVTVDNSSLPANIFDKMEENMKEIEDGESFKWESISAKVEGSFAGGPRPFASKEFDIIAPLDNVSGIPEEVDGSLIAELESIISERTRGGIYDISPDILIQGDEMVVKTRTDEIYKPSYSILMEEILGFFGTDVGIGEMNIEVE